MKTEKTDVLIIGAGPSGTTAASMINKNGLKAKIVEKEKFPRFVIGESLLPRCMDILDEAGFLEALKKRGYQKKLGALFFKDDKRTGFEFSEQFTKGWKWTWQVPRGDFDKVMADEVEKMGVTVDYETTVTGIEFFGSDSITTVKDRKGNKSQIKAKFIIDASGYGRVIPRLFDLNIPSTLPKRDTIFTHLRDTRRPKGKDSNRIIIVAHRQDVWIWIIPFSNGYTSVGFVGNPKFFDEFSGSQEKKLRDMIKSNPHLENRFRNTKMLFDPITIQGYSISIKKLYGEGFVLTGNATEFLDPVFSSGVTFALESGAAAGKLVSRQLKGEVVDWDKQYTTHIMQGVETFRSFVLAWYEGTLQNIFFAPRVNRQNKNQICSVLAGYVWDMDNPYVRKHKQSIATLAKVVEIEAA